MNSIQQKDEQISADRVLVTSIQEGDNQAKAAFWSQYWPALCKHLEFRYKENRDQVEDVVTEFMHECIGLRKRKTDWLGKWRGEGTLAAYLSAKAVGKLSTFLERKKPVDAEVELNSNDQDRPDIIGTARDERTDDKLSEEVMLECAHKVANVFYELGTKKPRDMAIFLLKCAGVQQQAAGARVWQLEKDAISHALGSLEEKLKAALEASEINASELAAVWKSFPHTLHGVQPGVAVVTDLTEDEANEIRMLSMGHPPASTGSRNKAPFEGHVEDWTKRFWREPAAFDWLVRCLRAESKCEVPVPLDNESGTLKSRLSLAVSRALTRMKPSDIARLLPSHASTVFAAMLQSANADGGTLWLLNDRERALEAVVNPLEPQILGKKQKLIGLGIMNSVYLANEEALSAADRVHEKRGRTVKTMPRFMAVRQSLSVNEVIADRRYSNQVDRELGTQTQHLIVVPFECGGDLRGVLTMVRLKDCALPFVEGDLAIARALSYVLGTLVDREVEQKLLLDSEAARP